MLKSIVQFVGALTMLVVGCWAADSAMPIGIYAALIAWGMQRKD